MRAGTTNIDLFEGDGEREERTLGECEEHSGTREERIPVPRPKYSPKGRDRQPPAKNGAGKGKNCGECTVEIVVPVLGLVRRRGLENHRRGIGYPAIYLGRRIANKAIVEDNVLLLSPFRMGHVKKQILSRNPSTSKNQKNSEKQLCRFLSTKQSPPPPVKRPSISFLQGLSSVGRDCCFDGRENRKCERNEDEKIRENPQKYNDSLHMGETQNTDQLRSKNCCPKSERWGISECNAQVGKAQKRRLNYQRRRAKTIRERNEGTKHSPPLPPKDRTHFLVQKGVEPRGTDVDLPTHKRHNANELLRRRARVKMARKAQYLPTKVARVNELKKHLQGMTSVSGSGFAPLRINVQTDLNNEQPRKRIKLVAKDKEQADMSLPLYAPLTKKLCVAETRRILEGGKMGPDIIAEIMLWLSSENHYYQLLRNSPTQRRPIFRNCVAPDTDLLSMLNSQIIEEADGGETVAYVKFKTHNENNKSRRKILFETRTVNRAINQNSGVLSKLQLPGQSEIEETLLHFDKVDSLDFKSFFYQIELAPNIRKFFRVYINNKLYQLRVLPMGACFSVFVAQNISLAACEIIKQAYPPTVTSLVYVDNIYIFHSLKSSPCDTQIFARHSLPQLGETLLNQEAIRILGRQVDMRRKTIQLPVEMVQKIENIKNTLHSSLPFSLRTYLQMWGSLIWATRVLHIPLTSNFHQFSDLSRACVDFLSGMQELDDILRNWQEKQKRLEHLFREVDFLSVVTVPSFQSTFPSCVIHTDASDRSAAVVLIACDALEIDAWQVDKEVHINEKEMTAGERGIELAIKRGFRNILWYTDSRTVYHCARRGRTKNKEMNKSVQNILTQDAWIILRWLKSEENVADGPSRGKAIQDEENRIKDIRRSLRNERNHWEDILPFGSRWRSGGDQTLEQGNEQA